MSEDIQPEVLLNGFSREFLLLLFAYDPETGVLTRRRSCGTGKAGGPAGSRYSNGYIYVQVCGRRVLAHRLIYFMVSGVVPIQIDHINRIRNDNRQKNLRHATAHENRGNSKLHAHNTSGLRGVSYDKRKARKPWVATIGAGTSAKHRCLGYFATKEEAGRRYDEVAREYFGEFATVNYKDDDAAA